MGKTVGFNWLNHKVMTMVAIRNSRVVTS